MGNWQAVSFLFVFSTYTELSVKPNERLFVFSTYTELSVKPNERLAFSNEYFAILLLRGFFIIIYTKKKKTSRKKKYSTALNTNLQLRYTARKKHNVMSQAVLNTLRANGVGFQHF